MQVDNISPSSFYQLMSLSNDQLDELEVKMNEKIKMSIKRNDEISKDRTDMIDSLALLFKSKNISINSSFLSKSKSKFNKEFTAILKKTLNMMPKTYYIQYKNVLDQFSGQINITHEKKYNGQTKEIFILFKDKPSSLKELVENVKKAVENRQKIEDEENNKQTQLLKLSFEMLQKHSIETTSMSIKDIVNLADELAKEEHLKLNYKEGDELDISCCDDCSTWVYGERRCSCGSVRCDIEVYGDIVSGYHSYVTNY